MHAGIIHFEHNVHWRLIRNVSNDMKMMSAYKDPNKVIFQYQVFSFFF